jgi:hypothetical protein
MHRPGQILLIGAAVLLTGALYGGDAAAASKQLVVAKVTSAPVIDGVADDAVWAKATDVVTHDPQAKADLRIKAVYTDDMIYVLATFPDKTESRTHKTLTWDAEQARYRTGVDREDTFVIKWAMSSDVRDLRVDAERPYKADIWFWKATRTDPSGYADDKSHTYSATRGRNSKTVLSRSGQRFYLSRPGDSGKSAYKTIIYADRVKDRMPLYKNNEPKGSRADVRAKGQWRNGVWTVEFARKLVTGNADDVEFKFLRSYKFGVARYEIAGRRKNPKLEQPWYGAGEITELMTLRFD